MMYLETKLRVPLVLAFDGIRKKASAKIEVANGRAPELEDRKKQATSLLLLAP